MAGAAAIPDDAGSEAELEAPEEVADESGSESSGQSELSALNDEVLDQADAFVGEDDAEEVEKPAAKKKVAAKSESEDADEEAPKKAPPKKDSGASKRIQQLVQREKEVRAQAQRAEQQFRQWQQQSEARSRQTEQRLQEREREHAVAMKELEMIRHREEQAQEAALDPLEKAMRIERRKAASEIEGKFAPQIQQAQREAAAVKKQFQEYVESQKREQRVQQKIGQYTQNADAAVSSMLKGFSSEDAAQLSPRVRTQILNYAAAHNILPDAAAKEWDRIAHAYVLRKMKLKAAPNGEAAKKGAGVPPGNPAGRKVAKGNGTITQSQAVKSGHRNALAASIASNPPNWARR